MSAKRKENRVRGLLGGWDFPKKKKKNTNFEHPNCFGFIFSILPMGRGLSFLIHKRKPVMKIKKIINHMISESFLKCHFL